MKNYVIYFKRLLDNNNLEKNGKRSRNYIIIEALSKLDFPNSKCWITVWSDFNIFNNNREKYRNKIV